MRLSPFIYAFILFSFCIRQEAAAQYAEKDFIRYSIKDGLSDSYITCLQQDEFGYIWIGTYAGLNRFDGTAFKNYYQNDLPLGLPSVAITRLKRYGSHQLGIIGHGGLTLLNTKTYAVKSYVIPDSTAFTTPLNAVWDAVPVKGDTFALTSAAGFYVLNSKGNVLLRHDAFRVEDIGSKRILYGRDIFNTGNGKYLVYINENGQAVYDDKKKTFNQLKGDEREWQPFLHRQNLPNNRWLTMRQLNEHEFLFLSVYEDSIFYYNSLQKKSVVSRLPFSVPNELTWISRIEPVNDSTFLVNCGNTGFYRMTLNKQTGAVFCDGKKFLPNHEILSLLSDKDGRLWVGTTEGLLKQELTPPFINVFNYASPDNSNKLYSGEFNCIYRYKNLLYTGRYSRDRGLFIIEPGTMQLVKRVQFYNDNSPWNEVMGIQMYHPDTLWIGTWAGLLWYDIKNGHYGKVLDEKKYPWATEFSVVLAPQKGDYAWMCGFLGGKVVRYHIPSRTFTLFTSQTKPALPFDKVKSIAYDSFGDVWIGGHALARWNSRLQQFDTLIKVYGGANKFNDDIIAFSADANGSLWMHNADNGLLEYRIAEKKFMAYGMKDGLPSISIKSLSRIIDDKLWLASSNKLCLLDTRSKKFTLYDQSDGLPDLTPTCRRIFYDAQDKQMYLFSGDNVIRFPLAPKRAADNSGALLLEEVSINNERSLYQPAGTIEVKFNENNLRFDFTVVDFENGGYRFTYRLNNTTWTSVGSQRSIRFNNLSAGEYQVEVKAVDKLGTEKTKKFLLIVQPPFWLKAPFLALVSALFIGVVYLLFRARVRRVRQRANLDKLLSQTEMKALQAQMNPHFIFNSLNSIREMILNNENKDASHYLSKFAHLIRLTLDQSAQAAVSLRATIDYLKRYMEMETIRNSLFTYEVIVDANLDMDETFVSPMLIQPFIENAIWHGVSALRKNIHVQVFFKKEDGALVCTIDDDGVGISHAQKQRSPNGTHRQSHGIANIKNRIALLNKKYNLNCGISIADKKEMLGEEETGTLVTLQLPLQTTEL